MIRPILGAALALSITAMPAFAASIEKFEMSVDIDRTALESVEGANQELTKIRADIHDRCVAEHAQWPFSSDFAVNFCETRTLKSAVKQIDDPNLTAAYQASVSR